MGDFGQQPLGLGNEDKNKIWDENQEVPAAVDRCIHDLFAEQAKARPSALALYAWDGELTYGELDELSSRLAIHLITIGVKIEDIVPLCFEKSMWMVIAMLAVLKAGGAFLPLDPGHPKRRHDEIFKQTGAKVVLASNQYSTLWPDTTCDILVVRYGLIGKSPKYMGQMYPTASPSNAAIIMFTSGSTGTPKGIVLEHRGVSTNCLAHGKAFGITFESRVFQFASYTFDVCTEIITPLLYGGCVCIPSEGDRRDHLADTIRRMGINWAFFTPTIARLLEPSTFPSLKILALGGEQVGASDWNRWKGHVQLINTYGPTECSVWCTSYKAQENYQSGTIGTCIGCVGWVADPEDHDRLAPLGSIGELLVEGPILARGYLNDAEKTAAVFIYNPSWLVESGTGHPGRQGRLYKTGDLVYYSTDGNLVYVSRKDGQVKVRGQRVELGEIEHHVRKCMPTVAHLVVELITPTGGKDSSMVAVFLQLNDELRHTLLLAGQGAKDDNSLVQVVYPAGAEDKLAEQLPSYMVPAVFFALKQLPLTSSCKTDRKRLREIGASFSAQQLAELRSQGPKRRPLTDPEKTLQQLWAQVLDIEAESIGLDDSFFRLGGDSIAAMKLVAEARKEDHQLTVAQIFKYPRLIDQVELRKGDSYLMAGDIAAFSLLGPGIDIVQVCEEVAKSCGIDASLVEDAYPCSPLQEGMISLTSKGASDYIMQAVLELRPDVNEDAFRAAWEQVVNSLAILRTRIVQHGKLGMLQAVLVENVRWVEMDNLRTYLAQDKSASMELGEPLARYALVKEQQQGRTWFVWTIHHALYDAWSLPRILNAVKRAYDGLGLEKQPTFSTFMQYIGRLDQEAAVTYWQSTLAGCEMTPFPPLPSTVQHPVANATVEYRCAPLVKTASDATTSTLIRAAWAILVGCYTHSDDVVFGATTAGRNAPIAGIEAIAGPTIATVPVRIRLHNEQSVMTFLETIQEQATEMIPFDQTGLQRIAKMGLGAKYACDFQTLLVVQPADDVLESDTALGKWQTGPEPEGFTTYALIVQCRLAREGVRITANFDPRVREQWQVEKMLEQFSFVMQQLARADSNTTVAEIDMVTSEDRKELWEWNNEVPPTVERCIHDLFTDQAKVRPSAPAICAWDGEMTYSELDELSSRLASYLVSLGVELEDVVPLCFEKSMWIVVAMLAVLKAGGAFVPLDPEHPASRHEEVFRQTKAKVVLASEQYSERFRGGGRTVATVSGAGERREIWPTVQPSNTAYVIFTSGSTGTPKGVVIEHRAIASSCLGHGQAFGFTKETRALQFASYSFDACIQEIITTVLHGGCVCVPSEEEKRNNLGHAFRSLGVTWAFLTPSVAQLLELDAVPSLRALTLGGENVTLADWTRWSGTVQMMNGYGPAECSIVCTLYSGKQAFASGTIGKSIASVSWVVDPSNHDRLMPLGSVGELLVEGPILARGYLSNAEKTAAAFIYDPAWLLTGCEGRLGRQGRLYKTGDLVHYDRDGNLVYIGRKDSQVKIRGQRMELGEIEHHMRELMPAVTRMAVEVVAPGGEKDKAVLATFLQLGKESPPEDNSLARVFFQTDVDGQLNERLPSYMVPEVYFAVAQLPMTTSSKTDRKRLREIGASFSAQQLAELRSQELRSQGPKRQLSTDQEKTLQRLWACVLNIEADSIGLDDSFFRLGGDSIAVMKLVAEARKEGFQLKSADIFQHAILVDLASILRTPSETSPQSAARFSSLTPVLYQAIFSGATQASPFVHLENVEDILHASSMQKFFLAQGERNPRAAFNYFYLDLDPALHMECLEKSCRLLTDNYAILRTHFAYFDNNLLQAVLRDFDVPFARFEVKGHMDQESNALCLQDIETSSPLGVPTSFMLVRNAPGAARLIVRLSHAQYDGVCIPVILNALASFYHNGTLSPAPDFFTYLTYSRQINESSACYWKDLLRDSHFTKIIPQLSPTDCSEEAPRNITLKQSIPIPRLPNGTTVASMVSSAWAVVLSRVSGEDDVVYGHLVAGRNSDIPSITEIVGPCLNIIPARANVSASITGECLIRSLQEQYASLGEADSMDFGEIVSRCTDWPAGTTFDSVVQHQNIDEHPEVRLAGGVSKMQWFENPFELAPYLSVFSQVQAGSLHITIGGNTCILTANHANELLKTVCETIEKLSTSPHVTLESYKLSSATLGSMESRR